MSAHSHKRNRFIRQQFFDCNINNFIEAITSYKYLIERLVVAYDAAIVA